MFEDEFNELLRKQQAEARGQRKEKLEGDIAGTKKMLEVIYPVIETLEGIVLEYEMVSLSGIKIYGDAFVRRLKSVLEEEHFITHAELVSRKRFSFERARARSVAVFGYSYFPYGRDELEQRPDECRRDFRALIHAKATIATDKYANLSVLEREALRYAVMQIVPIDLSSLSGWLHLKRETTSKVAKSLIAKGLFNQVGGGSRRIYDFELSDYGRSLIQQGPTG